MRLLRAFAAIALALVAIAVALVLCELLLRVADGQPILAWVLPPAATAPSPANVHLDPNIGGPLPADIDPLWIDAQPPSFAPPPTDAALEKGARLWRDPKIRFYETFRNWNRAVVRATACRPDSIFPKLPQPLLVFDAPNGNKQPPFRYLASRTLPGGLMTNRFGWRGADVPNDKPANTIRLAFVGASTTVGLWLIPFSYPEYVLHWLNLWAERAGLSVRFDGFNAGREGLGSGAIVAVALDEAAPLEPDLVVYYEGANQSLCHEPVVAPDRPSHGSTRQRIDRLVEATRRHSEIARRIEILLEQIDARGGAEPTKPSFTENWFPTGLDEEHPDIFGAALPETEQAIVNDIDRLRTQLDKGGTTLVLSSFVWLVYDGMVLEPRRDGGTYRMLNQMCWPHSYRDLRRGADLHNRILQQYATRYGLPFVDVAAQFPNDPSIFFDAIHLGSEGTRIHAWLVFRALVPLIRSRIDAGAWPRPDQAPLLEHPNIKPPEPYTVACEAPPTLAPRVTPTPRTDGFF